MYTEAFGKFNLINHIDFDGAGLEIRWMEMGDTNNDLTIRFFYPIKTTHWYKDFTSATSFDIKASESIVSKEFDPASLYIKDYDFETHKQEKRIDILKTGTKKIAFRAKFDHHIWWT